MPGTSGVTGFAMSDADRQSVAFRTYVSAEDHGRANFYALISRLLAAPADKTLLTAIAGSPPLATEDDGGPLPTAWSKLIAASGVMDEDAADEEYEALFGGMGKSALNLHASHHLTGFMMEKPLADIRSHIATLGFSRLDSQSLVEDHLAALCEVMRLLIVGSEEASISPANLQVQRQFFELHIAPWFEKCCTAIVKHPLANYYGIVAQFGCEFLRVELESFTINA
jgi:TorA maturation chaperone TorD